MAHLVQDHDRPPNLSPCPTDEALAVWLEGGLDAAAAADLEAHVAGCASCAELLAALAPALDHPAVPAADTDTTTDDTDTGEHAAPGWHVRPWLALAATLVVAAGGWAFVQFQHAPDAAADLARLRAIRVDVRPTHGRMSSFAWAAPPPTTRAGTSIATAASPALLDAAAAIGATHANSNTPDALHAHGVALLVAGETDRAIALLERASTMQPDRPDVLNDLAVAYLQRAWTTTDPPALAEARRLAERVVQLDAAAADAWFNLALVGRLSDDDALVARAVDALGRLERDADWVREARLR